MRVEVWTHHEGSEKGLMKPLRIYVNDEQGERQRYMVKGFKILDSDPHIHYGIMRYLVRTEINSTEKLIELHYHIKEMFWNLVKIDGNKVKDTM